MAEENETQESKISLEQLKKSAIISYMDSTKGNLLIEDMELHINVGLEYKNNVSKPKSVMGTFITPVWLDVSSLKSIDTIRYTLSNIFFLNISMNTLEDKIVYSFIASNLDVKC